MLVTLEVFQPDKFPIDHEVAFELAPENIYLISVTLEVFQPDKSKLNDVAFLPISWNKYDILTTLEVSHLDISRLKVVE